MNDIRTPHRPCAGALDFVVGQSRRGLWLAVETHGKGGGLFVSRQDALRFAARESHKAPAEIRVTSEPVELRI